MAEEQAKVYLSAEARFDEAINQIKELVKELKTATGNTNLFEKVVGKLDNVLDMASGSIASNNATLETMNVTLGKSNSLIEQLVSKNQKLTSAAKASRDELRKQTKSMNDMAAQANRFNTGNIAAQAQDIIVTAQMGMRPITIGLQQGTQLLYVLQQSKAPLQEFVAGIKSLISPLSLVVVGLTTVIAAFIQWVDWIKVGKTVLDGLANGFEYVAENAEIFTGAITAAGVALIAFNGKAILGAITGLWKLGATALVTGTKIAFMWVASTGPVGLVLAGIAAVTVAFLKFKDEVKDLFDGKFGKYVKVAVNAMIGSFVAAIDTVVQSVIWAWEKIQSLWGGKGPEKGFMDTIEQTINKDISRDYLQMGKEGLSALDKATGASEKFDKIVNGVKSSATVVSNKFKNWSEHLGETTKDAEKLQKKIDKINDSYENLFTKRNDDLEKSKLKDSLEGLTAYEKTYQTVVYEMTKDIEDLKKEAIAAGIPLTKINEMFANSKTRIQEVALAEAEYAQEKENLIDFEKAYNAVIDQGASLTKGFFSDLKSGLKEGQSAWESFTNAVVNMLDKIQDKIMDLAIDMAFENLKSSGGSGSGSWLGSLVSAGMSLFGGGATGSESGAKVLAAAGGAGKIGVKPTMTANGGVFSNGIYSSPTVFQFAKGGKFGVMGEAGPEAVVPLKRSKDGSLGISADGIGDSSPVIVNVINNSNAQARTEKRQTDQGVEIDVLIDEMVAQKLGTNGTASNSALRAYNNRQLIMR